MPKTTPGSVAVGFCYAQSTITPQWRRSYQFVMHRDAATKRRVVGEFAHEVSGTHIPRARCQIVEDFLKHPAKPEWLWMIDTDATFADDCLERLIASADPKTRPIVGALAFGVRPAKDETGREVFNSVGAASLELFPTIYLYTEQGTATVYRYPRDQIVQCHATGAHCLLIHRTVLEDPRWVADGHPLPWFRTAVAGGGEVSEDQFFCMKAGSFGYPIHVDTSIKTGHVKTFIAEEDLYLAQNGVVDAPVRPASERVDVIVPVLHRPQNIAPLLKSAIANTDPELLSVWFVCEPDDLEVWAEVQKHGGKVLVCPGSFAQKVNFAYTKTDAPWLMLVGDDVVFHPGWLDHAQAAADDGACVVGTNDLGNPNVTNGSHATHMMIRRSYVDAVGASWDGPGVVCHEYRHCFVDNEIVEAAKQRGVWTPCLRSIVEHRHPMWGKAANDDVYRKGTASMKVDEKEFVRRRSESKVLAS